MLPIGRTTPASPSITTGLTSPGLRPRADLIGGPVAWSLCRQWSAGCDMHVNESKTRHTNLFLLQRAPAHRACRRLCPEDSPQYQQSINPLVSSGGRFGNVDPFLLCDKLRGNPLVGTHPYQRNPPPPLGLVWIVSSVSGRSQNAVLISPMVTEPLPKRVYFPGDVI